MTVKNNTLGKRDAFYNSTTGKGSTKEFGILVSCKAAATILKPYLTKAGLKQNGEGKEVAKGIQLTFTGSSPKALRLALRKAKGQTTTPTFRGNTCKYMSEPKAV